MSGALGVRAQGPQPGAQVQQPSPEAEVGGPHVVGGQHPFHAQVAVHGRGLQHEEPVPLPAPPAGRGKLPLLQRQGGAEGRGDQGGRHGWLPEPAPVPPVALQEARGAGLDGFAAEEAPQVAGQGGRRGVAQPRVGIGAFAHDAVQVPGHRPALLRWRAGPASGIRSLGRPAMEREVEGAAQGEHVGGRADPPALAPDLLGGHVGGGAVDPQRGGEGGAAQFHGQPEVADIGRPAALRVRVQEDVGGFEVPVDEHQLMGGLDAFGHLGQEAHNLLHAQSPAGVGQGRAPHQLHGDPGGAFAAVHIEDLADVGVDQPALEAGFVHEPDQAARVHLPQHLQGDGPAQDHVPGFPHLAHAALAQERAQHVPALPGMLGVKPSGLALRRAEEHTSS